MPDSPDKVQERWWAKFLGGVRHASQGFSFSDLSGKWFVGEHKYRKLEQYSAEFRKAIKQSDENWAREKKKTNPRIPLVLFTFHGGVGQNARRFLMLEVFNKDKDIETLLENLLKRIKQKDGTEVP